MTASQGMEERNLFPRWRPFRVSAAVGELSCRSLEATDSSRSPQADMEALGAFKASPSLFTAADALGLAASLSDPEPLRPVLEFIESSAGSNRLLANAAARVKQRLNQHPPTTVDDWFDAEDRNLAVRRIRSELRSRPRNPTKWVDLALAQTLIGQVDKARRSIITALGLAPHNRFVLRSAVRFFIHIDEPDTAQFALRSAKGTADPWILAAEVATDEAAGAKPSSMKDALFVLSSGNFSSWDLSELACAIAHVEFTDGRDKRARRFLEQAMPEPTENAAAQIVFESNRGGFTAKPIHEPERRFEAEAIEASWRKDWPAAITSGLKWQLDQPFAVEPASFLSYVAAVGAEQYDVAEQAARRGRLANPHDATIANNLAFALANQDKNEEAANVLASFPAPQDDREAAVYNATRGLVAFRSGKPDVGRTQYELSVRESADLGLPYQAALAASFWAREEVRSKTRIASEVVSLAKELASRVPDSDATVVLRRLEETGELDRIHHADRIR